MPPDTKPRGDNPAGIASSLLGHLRTRQAARTTVTLLEGSKAPGRDIRAGKLRRELRALQKGTYFKQNIYNTIQW